MIRRERLNDQQRTDRWLISYADFITLLFAFFVVMYSISQVNEGKYRILSESLVSAFDVPERSLQPIQFGEINRSDVPYQNTRNNLPGSENPGYEKTEGNQQADANELQQLNATAKQSKEEFNQLQQTLNSEMENLISQGVVNIKATEDWIEIEMPSGLLFSSGSDRMSNSALLLVREISQIINNSNNLIRIRGFTDNIPVAGGKFSSNWALSAARAVAVVQLLQRSNIEPERLALEGYGEFSPKINNNSIQNRAENRRVVIAISRFIRGNKTPLVAAKAEAETVIEAPPEALTSTVSETATPKLESPTNTVAEDPVVEEELFELIRAPDGRLIIRGKNVPKDAVNP